MDKARDFGAGALFNQILSLLMSQNLEDQERHLLVKDREIISNLSIAAGLPKVISTMRSGISSSPSLAPSTFTESSNRSRSPSY
ncbi:6987_t:CDS:2 [Entrophospora sp. SA101]|nr:7919_t:CDS:2 [Entrophospora sp. SA101]CAJ0916037.1 6987_t:CDS:2 [Entrophospora sp. SA101]